MSISSHAPIHRYSLGFPWHPRLPVLGSATATYCGLVARRGSAFTPGEVGTVPTGEELPFGSWTSTALTFLSMPDEEEMKPRLPPPTIGRAHQSLSRRWLYTWPVLLNTIGSSSIPTPTTQLRDVKSLTQGPTNRDGTEIQGRSI